MYNLKIKDKEYSIKFAYIPTLKSDLISKMVKMGNNLSQDKTEDIAAKLLKIKEMLLFIPEIVLVGLQKNHKDEFGYAYDTNEGRDAALDKVFDMMDDYFDENDASIMQLYTDLQNEMFKEGFLKSLFQQEKANSEKAVEQEEINKEIPKT